LQVFEQALMGYAYLGARAWFKHAPAAAHPGNAAAFQSADALAHDAAIFNLQHAWTGSAPTHHIAIWPSINSSSAPVFPLPDPGTPLFLPTGEGLIEKEGADGYYFRDIGAYYLVATGQTAEFYKVMNGYAQTSSGNAGFQELTAWLYEQGLIY
jgi:hypothetical protein